MSCCAACGHEIVVAGSDFRLPPWCPGCGADLKLGDKPPGLRPPVPRAPVAQAPPRRPTLSNDAPEEPSLPDGYLLTGAQGESRASPARLLTDVWVWSAAGAVFLVL